MQEKTAKRQAPGGDPDEAGRPGFRLTGGEAGGAFGDLGTFLPHVVGVLTIGGLAPGGLLLGFGLFYLASGLIYRLPIPVQPMKAVSAVIVTSGLTPGAVAATGLVLGVVLLVLALSGLLDRLARGIPASVVAGLQLGLGLSLAWLALDLMAANPWLGGALLVLVLLLGRLPHCPAALVTVGLAILAGQVFDLVPALGPVSAGFALPPLALPSLPDVSTALQEAVIPQIALTLTNAVIVTAALSRCLFPAAGDRVSERKLALTSGGANLLLAPFGALPMCHGAGGLQAHVRFGARSGAALLIMGVLLAGLGLFFADAALGLLTLIPLAAVGALLLPAAYDLAVSKRLFDARPDCWPAIAVTAAATLFVNAALGLALGCAIEIGRRAWRRRFGPSRKY